MKNSGPSLTQQTISVFFFLNLYYVSVFICGEVSMYPSACMWRSKDTYHRIPGNQTQAVQLSDKCLNLPTKPSCWLSTYILTKPWELHQL